MHTVTEAAASDRLAIERLYADAIGRAAWLPPHARLRVEFTEVSNGEMVHVIKAGAGELAGFVSVYKPESFVHHLFVAPQYQRQGLASSLLSSLHTWLPLPWRLKCIRGNTDALSFYAIAGWKEVGVGENEDGQYLVLEYNQEPQTPIENVDAPRAI